MKKFILLVLGCALAFGAEVKYAKSVKPLYLNASSTKVVGKLLPTSKVTILGKKDGKLRVKIEGFMLKGLDKAVYYAVGKRILVAGIANNSGFKFSKTTSFTDKDTGKTWYKASFEAYVDSKDLGDSVKTMFAEADKKYKETCSMCHSLHSTKEFTANQWPSMVKAMSSRAGLDKNTRYFMVEYLQKHAKDMEEK